MLTPIKPVFERGLHAALASPDSAKPMSAVEHHPIEPSHSGGNVFIARDLTKVYRMGDVEVRALDGVNLEIRAGEFVVLLGASGSGKSTLLNILGGLDTPTSGSAFWRDHDLVEADDAALTRYRRDHVGFVFQFYNLMPEFTARENVLLPMRRLARRTRHDMVLRADGLLQQLGLADQAGKLPRQLSGGQSQRVAIARALANEPTLILADEPTGNLDSASGRNVQETILRLAHEYGRAVAVVTHDPAFAARADRILTLVDGRLVA